MAIFNGTSRNDTFIGTIYNDEFRMLAHYGTADVVDGGKGSDTLSYTGADRAVRVTMAEAGQYSCNDTRHGGACAPRIVPSLDCPVWIQRDD